MCSARTATTFDLIEVKSKAGDSNEYRAGTLFTGAKGGIRSEWRDYLEDVAYQAGVLRAAYPQAAVRCFLLTPDKAKTARLDGLCQRFRIRREGRAVEVDVVGDPAELRREDILTLFQPMPRWVPWPRRWRRRQSNSCLGCCRS